MTDWYVRSTHGLLARLTPLGELDREARLAAEQRARVVVDRQLFDAGWVVQDKKHLTLFAAEGVACREVVMKAGHGRADYVLDVAQEGCRRPRARTGGHCPVKGPTALWEDAEEIATGLVGQAPRQL
ncbi:MAG: box helicase [Humibacillus sp.]|nr:box helicase [Humibacillus sp.]